MLSLKRTINPLISVNIQGLFLGLLVLFFMAPAMTFMGGLAPTVMRWVLPIVGVVWVVLKQERGFFQFWNTLPGKVFVLYLAFCIITVFWSEFSDLTEIKALAQIFVAVAMFCFSAEVGYRSQPYSAFDFMIVPTVFVLVTAIAGAETGVLMSGDTELYGGATNSPNTFGTMIAMCSVWIIWRVYSVIQSKLNKSRWFWFLLLGVMLIFLLKANSRSAIGFAGFSFLGLVTQIDRTRRGVILALLAVCMAGVMFVPDARDMMLSKFIYKYDMGGDTRVFASRSGAMVGADGVWDESFDAAIEGGFFGAGYGVSVGNNSLSQGIGFASGGYQREKGNSQLAMAEEVGVAGLLLFVGMMIAWFVKVNNGIQRLGVRSIESRLLRCIQWSIIGLLFHSIFEGWWTSPGSQELPFLFTLLGLGMGVLARGEVCMSQKAPLAQVLKIGS